MNDKQKSTHCEAAFSFFSHILGAIPGANARDSNLKYFWQLFSPGDLSRLELMKALGKGSFKESCQEP